MSLYFDSDYYDMIYEINFNRYTNGTRDAVSDDNNQYIETDDDGNLLIRSQEIPFYQKFGGGIKNMRFVGRMYYDQSTRINLHDIDNIDKEKSFTLKSEEGDVISIPYGTINNGEVKIVPCTERSGVTNG